MEATWNHPELGTLTRKGRWWRTVINAPAFDAFSYDTGYDNAGPPTGQYKLMIAGPKDATAPPPAAVALAAKVISQQTPLVSTIATALWDEFSGRGPDSQMWWYAGLDEFPSMLSRGEPPTSPTDVQKLIRLHAILIRDDVDGTDGAVAELGFWAAFEQEHDLGILTDGDRILGTGHYTEVTPYGFEYNE